MDNSGWAASGTERRVCHEADFVKRAERKERNAGFPNREPFWFSGGHSAMVEEIEERMERIWWMGGGAEGRFMDEIFRSVAAEERAKTKEVRRVWVCEYWNILRSRGERMRRFGSWKVRDFRVGGGGSEGVSGMGRLSLDRVGGFLRGVSRGSLASLSALLMLAMRVCEGSEAPSIANVMMIIGDGLDALFRVLVRMEQ